MQGDCIRKTLETKGSPSSKPRSMWSCKVALDILLPLSDCSANVYSASSDLLTEHLALAGIQFNCCLTIWPKYGSMVCWPWCGEISAALLKETALEENEFCRSMHSKSITNYIVLLLLRLKLSLENLLVHSVLCFKHGSEVSGLSCICSCRGVCYRLCATLAGDCTSKVLEAGCATCRIWDIITLLLHAVQHLLSNSHWT